MKQLYNKDIYDVNKPVKSYWEKVSQIEQDKYPKLTTDESCDVCVIGGGFTGISTAYHIAKNYSGDVRLLEAFACNKTIGQPTDCKVWPG